MSPLARQSRVATAGLRLGLVTIPILAVAGSWLTSALAGGDDRRPLAARIESEGSSYRDVPAVTEPAGSGLPAEQPPAGDLPSVAPELTRQEQELVSLQPDPMPEPTTEPWGPSRIALYDPASDQSVPAGGEAIFVLEVAHLGAGGPDAKEIRHDAPAGWDVRVTSATDGEPVHDSDGDGRVETRPLFRNDVTSLAVAVTTPADLIATSTA